MGRSKAMDDFFARETGQRSASSATTAEQPSSYDNWLTGAVSSTISAIPELFGENPTPIAEEFRRRNPISGFATEMLPMMVGGAGSASIMARTGRLAALETGLAKRGLGAATAPIRNAAIKTVVAEAPFELARGAIGTFTAPEENVGDLWGSVALNIGALGAVGGGIGALSKAGGKATRANNAGILEDLDPAMAPGYTMKAALEKGPENAKWVNDGEWDANMATLREEALLETPGAGGVEKQTAKYVEGMTEATEESLKDINSLFKVNKGDESLDIRYLKEGADESKTTVNAGEQALAVKGTGHENIDDFLSNVRYGRQIRVNSEDAARSLSAKLDKAPGLQKLDGNSWAGTTDNGSIMFVKRVERNPDAVTPKGKQKGSGPNKIYKGDKFVIGLTEHPDRILPEGHAFASKNANIFAKIRSAFHPGHQSDQFSDVSKGFVAGITEQDLAAVRTLPKRKAVNELAKRMAEKAGVEVGETVTRAADQLYGVIAPAARKRGRNLMYHRMRADLELRMKKAGALNAQGRLGKAFIEKGGWAGKQLHGGLKYTPDGPYGTRSDSAILADLTDEEAHFVGLAGIHGIGPDNVSKIVPEGMNAEKIQNALREFQAEDSNFIREFEQTFKNTELENSVPWKENFISHGMFSGQWKVPILDGSGKQVYWTSGKSKLQAEEISKRIIAEAEKKGDSWTAGKTLHATQTQASEIEKIHERLVENLVKDNSDSTLDTVMKAIQQYGYEKAAKGRRQPKVGKPGRLQKGQEGRVIDPEVQITKQDLMENRSQHRKALLDYSAHFGWRERWGDEIARLQKVDPLLFDDIQRTANQFVGIEGKYTKMVNQMLEPVLGSSLGGKPASVIMNAVNKNSYLWTHAILNPSAALVNLTTPLMTTLPNIAYLSKLTSDEILDMFHVMPRFDSTGKVAGMTGGLSPLGVLKEGMRMMMKPQSEEGLLEAYARAQQEGDITQDLTAELLGTSSKASMTIKEAYQQGGWWEATNKGLTYMAQKSEEYPRLLAFNVGFKMAKNMGLEGDALYNTAVNIMNKSMYGYRLTDRSRLITGPLGSSWGLFKNFAIHYIDDMIRYAGMGVQKGEWGPMAWMLGSTTAVGGIGATPLVTFADGLAKWQGDHPDSYSYMDANFGEFAKYAEYGFPAGLGVSLQSSVMMPGVDPGNDLGNFLNAVAIRRGMDLSKAVGTAFDYAENNGGAAALSNKNVRDQLMGALLPRAGNRVMASVEGEYIKSMNSGYPGVREVDDGYGGKRPISPGERLIFGLGLTPTGVAREQYVGRQVWKETERQKAIINALGKRFAEALTYDDREEMTRVISEATYAGVKVGSVLKSGRTIWKREQGDLLSRYDPGMVEEFSGDQ